MSVENGARFARLLEQDAELRKKVRDAGEAGFLAITAESQASCTPFEVVSALIKEMKA